MSPTSLGRKWEDLMKHYICVNPPKKERIAIIRSIDYLEVMFNFA